MSKKSIQAVCTILLFIGVFGSIACRHYGINDALGIFALRSAIIVGLLGGYRYLESKGNKGKRIINLILLVALAILVAFAFGELIDDLRK